MAPGAQLHYQLPSYRQEPFRPYFRGEAARESHHTKIVAKVLANFKRWPLLAAEQWRLGMRRIADRNNAVRDAALLILGHSA